VWDNDEDAAYDRMGESDDAVVASWVAEARARHDALASGQAQGLAAQEFRSWFKSL
jgi:hypothetical protein